MRITSTDGSGTALPNTFVELAGPSTSPSVELSQTTFSYAPTEVGTISGEKTVVIRNTGTGTLVIGAPTLTDTTNFNLSANTCAVGTPGSTLGPGAACEMRVTFTPKTPNTFNGILQIPVSINGANAVIAHVALNGAATQGTLTANPGSIQFPDRLVNTISPTTTVTLTNNSGQVQSIPNISLINNGGSNFFLVDDICTGQSLAPNTGTCTFGVFFRPTAAGQQAAQVQVSRVVNGGGVVPLLLQLNGNGLAGGGDVTITPATRDFGSTPIGQQGGTQAFVVRNNGTSTLTVNAVFVNGPNAADFQPVVFYGCNNGTVLNPSGGNCTVVLDYAPQMGTLGARVASLNIGLSDGATPGPTVASVAAALNATATAALQQTATLTPNPQDFGTVQIGTQGAPVVFTLTNTGSQPIGPLGAPASVGVNADQFAVVNGSDCIGKTLTTASPTCTFSAFFRPTVNGILAASVSVPFQGATATPAAAASVFGTGSSASATLTPTPKNFGTVAVGYSSAPVTFTLTNTSTGPLTVGNGAVALSDATNFVIVKNDCSGTTLNAATPGNTCAIVVRYAPTGGPAGTTQSSSLSVGLANGVTATAQLSGTPIAPTAQLTLTPATANFGAVPIGYNSTTQTFTLTNTGNTAVVLLNPAAVIAPANPDFTILASGCDGSTLNPAGQQGNSCTIVVRFNPQAGPIGNRSASLAVNLGTNNGFAVAALNGQATAAPQVSATLTPSTHDFGTVVSGQPGPIQAFRLTNTSATLNFPITTAAVLNDDDTNFTILDNGCSAPRTLAPGDFCDIQVRFNPTTMGLKSTTLSIALPNGGAVNASLFGTSISNAYTITPTQLAFGDQALGTASAPKPVTITNTSAGTLDIGAINVPTGFLLVGDLCSNKTLALGASCTFNVVFSPTGTTTGPVSTTLTIAVPNGTTTPAQVSLTGNVTAAPQGAVTVTPAAYNYGNAQVLSPTAPQSFTLTNNGTRAVAVGGVSLTGDTTSFSVLLGNNCTNAALNPGQSCTVQVVFRPVATGPLQAQLNFVTDAPGNSTVAALYGVGISPRVTVTSPNNGRLDFGDIQVGTQSTTQRITVTNSTNGPITFGAPTVDGNYFVVNDNCATKTIEAGQTCTLDVLFAPGAPAGPQPGSVTLTTTAAGGSPASTYVVALYGVGITSSIAIGGPTNGRLDFGNVQVGTQSAAQRVTLTNSTTGPITFGATASTSPAFKIADDRCTGQTLAASTICTFDVYFAPTGAGAQSADITFSAGGTTYTVVAYGVAITPQVTLSNAGSLTFGDVQVGTQSLAQTITLTNSTTGPITIGPVTATANYLRFNDRCTGQTLAAGAICTVGVIFSPTTTGLLPGQLTIQVGTTTYVVNLDGNGVTTVATLDQAQLDFGNVLVGTESAPKTVTLTNRNVGPLTLGPVTSPDARFVVSVDNCSNATLGAGATCTFTVVFRPDQTGGIVNAQINVNSAAGSQVTLPNPLIVTVKGVGITAAATFSPVKLDFGNQPTNTPSGTKTITFTNSGDGPVSITGVSILGTTATPTTSAPNDFQIVGNFCAPRNGAQVVLAANDSCTISIYFQPTATGQRTALLQITTNSNGSPFSALLAGVGTTSSVSITPGSLDFGQQQVGVQSAPQTITLVNPSNGPLTITGVTLAGTNPGEFTLSNDTCTNAVLGNGSGGRVSCTVDVSFKPTSQGPKSGVARFTTSAPGGQLDVTLLGAGFLPVPVLQAAAVDFGNQVINTTSVAQTVTVTNRGPGTLQIDSVSITGTNAGDFKILFNNGCAGQLAPNQSCQVQVNFTPTALGQRQAFLTFNTNAAGNPNQTLLTGNGTPVPTYTTTVTTTTTTTTVNGGGNVAGSGCTAAASPAGPYQGNQQATLTAQYNPATTVFIGWTLDGTFVGFANPLTFNVNNSSHNVVATCVPKSGFSDVNSGTPYNDAIIQMTARGFIRGYGDGNFGPNDGILRAQMAGITTRLAGWSTLVKPNIFTDRCIASGCVDDELWNSVAVTAFFQVARGYDDNTYRPFDPVANIQAVAFITRTMVKLGYWQFQPDNTSIYPNIDAGTGHRIDISTYYYYAGAVPGTNPANNWNEWDKNSTRAYFAGIYWQAYQSYFGVDRVP